MLASLSPGAVDGHVGWPLSAVGRSTRKLERNKESRSLLQKVGGACKGRYGSREQISTVIYTQLLSSAGGVYVKVFVVRTHKRKVCAVFPCQSAAKLLCERIVLLARSIVSCRYLLIEKKVDSGGGSETALLTAVAKVIVCMYNALQS